MPIFLMQPRVSVLVHRDGHAHSEAWAARRWTGFKSVPRRLPEKA